MTLLAKKKTQCVQVSTIVGKNVKILLKVIMTLYAIDLRMAFLQ